MHLWKSRQDCLSLARILTRVLVRKPSCILSDLLVEDDTLADLDGLKIETIIEVQEDLEIEEKEEINPSLKRRTRSRSKDRDLYLNPSIFQGDLLVALRLNLESYLTGKPELISTFAWYGITEDKIKFGAKGSAAILFPDQETCKRALEEKQGAAIGHHRMELIPMRNSEYKSFGGFNNPRSAVLKQYITKENLSRAVKLRVIGRRGGRRYLDIFEVTGFF